MKYHRIIKNIEKLGVTVNRVKGVVGEAYPNYRAIDVPAKPASWFSFIALHELSHVLLEHSIFEHDDATICSEETQAWILALLLAKDFNCKCDKRIEKKITWCINSYYRHHGEN